MKIKAKFLIALIALISTTPIEIPLYKSTSAYEEFKKSDAKIEDIYKTHFLVDLQLGCKSFPLQVEMASEDVSVVNGKPKIDNPSLHNETELKIEKAIIGKKNFYLEYKLTEQILYETLNKESSGVLGLSLGDLEAKNDKKFVSQLVKNKVIDNKLFYFEFDEIRIQSTSNVPTLEDFLYIKGKVIFGDFPYIVSPKKYSKKVKTTPILRVIKNKKIFIHDDSSLAFQFDMEKCIECNSCIKACSNIAGQDILEYEKKEMVRATSGKLFSDTYCISCSQCTLLHDKKEKKEQFDKEDVINVLKNKNGKIVVCQFVPAIRINMAESLGVPVKEISMGKIVTALKKIGFDYIFDANFSEEMTIVEEATELIYRLNDPDAILPMFTSCCSKWVNYLEKNRPDLIKHLSSYRSPLAMLSSIIKNIFPKKIGVDRERIYNVAIMPCTVKKDENRRQQLSDETDAVISSRELAQMIKDAKIDFKNLEESQLDTIYSEYPGGVASLCATGGVMEAALRSAYKFITGKNMAPLQLKAVRGSKNGIKTATADINGIKVNVAVAHGIQNAMDLLDKVQKKQKGFENIHFIEVMECPSRCAMEGAPPKEGKKNGEKKLEATYKIDENSEKRFPQDNEQLNKLYEELFDGEYDSHYAHELLHNYYTNRRIDKIWGINFKRVNFNHTSISSFSSQCLIKVENNFISAPRNFLPVFQREFLYLPEFKDKCRLLASPKYQFVLCNKYLNIEKFPKLEFYSDELDYTFLFEGKDLFVFDIKNDNYLFLIVFDLFNPDENSWKLGLPFIIKEKIFFDIENENLGFCLEETIETKNNDMFLIIYANVITFICALFFGLLCMIPSKKKIKKRANEFNFDFEYAKA